MPHPTDQTVLIGVRTPIHAPILAAACVALSIGVARAAEVDLSKLPPPSTQKGLTYAKNIRPLFEASCFRCHGEEKQKGELRLDSLEAVMKGGEDGKVIEPGKSAASPLVIAVSRLDEEKAMPPQRKPGKGPGGPPPGGGGGGGGKPPGGPGGPGGGPMPKPLTAEEVGLVRAWIDQGAK